VKTRCRSEVSPRQLGALTSTTQVVVSVEVTRRHTFGPLELKILGLFGAEDALGATEVQARLQAEGDELAYTTVMTVLSRLAEKGALVRRREGKRFLYRAGRNTARLKSGVVARLHQALFAGTRLKPFAALLDGEDLSGDELRALRKLVDAKLKEQEP
jgi:predicted transcriptional regulator